MTFTLPPTAERDTAACLRWLPWEPEDRGPAAMLFAAGYQRNVIRHAQQCGVPMIAALVRAGLLEPEQDPTPVLEDLITELAGYRAGGQP